MRNVRTILASVLLILPVCGEQSVGKKGQRPVDVFAEFEGTWSGSFVGYDATGKELYRIAVTQTYKTVDANTQELEATDRMQDGKVITARGKNTARRLADGSLELKCIVDKSNGDHVEHDGRVVKGPSGEVELVWYSHTREKKETFREGVRKEGKTDIYYIQGMGEYGGKRMLMAGRYTRVKKKN